MTRPYSPRLTDTRPLRLWRIACPSWWRTLARYGKHCADTDYRRKVYTR